MTDTAQVEPKIPKPKGGARPGAGRKPGVRGPAAISKRAANKDPNSYDMVTAAAKFHYAEAAKAQATMRDPTKSEADRMQAAERLEHHIGKAATYSKLALPFDLAKMSAIKPPPPKGDADFDLSKVTDAELDTLERILRKASAAGADAGDGAARKTAPGN